MRSIDTWRYAKHLGRLHEYVAVPRWPLSTPLLEALGAACIAETLPMCSQAIPKCLQISSCLGRQDALAWMSFTLSLSLMLF
jgi:hypothetical protein